MPFINANDQPPPPRPRHITQYAWRTRIGKTLIAQMELAAMHNPQDPAPVQQAKAEQRAEMARAFSASYVDLDNEELQAAFTGVPAEAFERIFVADVMEIERP